MRVFLSFSFFAKWRSGEMGKETEKKNDWRKKRVEQGKEKRQMINITGEMD